VAGIAFSSEYSITPLALFMRDGHRIDCYVFVVDLFIGLFLILTLMIKVKIN
jgi:hypothetical protein